jgi:2-aminoethylphosphonate-pyruvate transaminase
MPSQDKLLFTPGPLTTSPTVKAAMQTDLGSRDVAFIQLVKEVREELVRLGNVSLETFTAIPMQGSGTFGVEAVLSSVVPRDGRLLVLANGAYGARIGQIGRVLGIDTRVLTTPEERKLDPEDVARQLAGDVHITHVAAVHCETTTGQFNPIERIGALVRSAGRKFIVDAMSSFGAVPIDLDQAGVDYLISSANKCIEGVPGFSFILARRQALAATEGWARSVALDLLAQWRGLDQSGQFRFTPPTHALLAFRQALRELQAEGGVEGRAARYRSNHRALVKGMTELGFEMYLAEEDQGYIITSFRYPRHPGFKFEAFYQRLSDKGFVIYPGKVSSADCFRIGTIGRLFPTDIEALLQAIRSTITELGIALP